MDLRTLDLALAGVCAASCTCEIASAQSTIRVSVDSTGAQGNESSGYCALSSDGQFVAFDSLASNLCVGDTNGVGDVFVHDCLTGETECVSVDPSGSVGDGESLKPAISADGRFIAFYSAATNLVSDDTNGVADVFVYDRETRVTERVSVDSLGEQADGESSSPCTLSADGRFVGFESRAVNLVDGDTNRRADVFVHDRATGLTERVSVASSGAQGNDASGHASISADARYVAFESDADNLVEGDANLRKDVFVRDRDAGTTELVGVDSSGKKGNGWSARPAISADGRFVSFHSDASNLVPDDTNDFTDAFIHDRQTGSNERVSVASDGTQVTWGGGETSVSADGRFVSFRSGDWDLVDGDANGRIDIFVHDRRTGVTRLVSVDSTGVQANFHSGGAAIAAGGRHIAFVSSANNLVSDDTGFAFDVFLRDQGPYAAWTNYGDGFAGSIGIPSLTSQNDPSLGGTAVLAVGNSSGTYGTALLFCGFESTDLTTSKGGTLLVDPAFTLLLPLEPWGPTLLYVEIPDDASLCTLHIYAQAIELDPGAAKGMSFTPGIDLVLGI